MAEAKTVDNLPPEVNNSYMRAMELLSDEEVRKVTQTPSIATRAELLKTATKPLEIDTLFGSKESEPSPFAEPVGFVLAGDVFSNLLIPSVKPTELREKLKPLKESDMTDEEKRQKQTLSKFANTNQRLNEILREIQKRKDEYHKG